MDKSHYIFYNDEWNPRGTLDDDSGHEDFVDSYYSNEEDTTYYDDYEDYGN